MSDLDLLLAVAGAVVTLFVVAGMVLITPRGQVQETPDHEATAPAGASPVTAPAPRSTDHSSQPVPAPAPIARTDVQVDGVASDSRPA